MSIPKDYLGDGVYVSDDGDGGVVLTTENGIRVQNRIHLEPAAIRALLGYLQRMGWKIQEGERKE